LQRDVKLLQSDSEVIAEGDSEVIAEGDSEVIAEGFNSNKKMTSQTN
jgi:hypothetical protein